MPKPFLQEHCFHCYHQWSYLSQWEIFPDSILFEIIDFRGSSECETNAESDLMAPMKKKYLRNILLQQMIGQKSQEKTIQLLLS